MNAAAPTDGTRQLSAAVRSMRLRLERAAGVTEAEPESQPMAAADTALPLPLALLAQRFSLSAFEQEVLLLALSWELDTRVASLCAAAQADPRKTYPTFGLALSLSDDPVWDALSAEGPLRHWLLIDLQATPDQPLTAWPLRVDERILGLVKGVHQLDARLAPLLESLAPTTEQPLVPSQQVLVEQLVARFRVASVRGRLPAVQLDAPDRRLASRVAVAIAAELGVPCYRLDAALLPNDAAELDRLVRLWERETVLAPAALFVDAHAADSGSHALARFAARCSGLLMITGRELPELAGRDSLRLTVARPSAAERRALWAERLPDLTLATSLADQFVLDVEQIEHAIASVPIAQHSEPNLLWRACTDATLPRAEGLMRRIEPHASWDDPVLAADELRTLHELAAQMRHRARVYEDWGFGARSQRGLALTALFAGESGTGKTLAAEVLASELRVPLLCVDLSAVVDKYIGETEKNLRRVFDAAEDASALLFFDEADALFGKRSEVKDAHDRFANIEINYLLQRMEAYRGLAVLATNQKSALDAAFMRRLRFHVRFAFPAERERRALWRRVFPSETPLAALDYERLASFALTGAAIRNIAINAAFLAADGGEAARQVSMPLVLDAIRGELRKLDQRVNESQFRDEAKLSGGQR